MLNKELFVKQYTTSHVIFFLITIMVLILVSVVTTRFEELQSKGGHKDVSA